MNYLLMIATGVVFGLGAVFLVKGGNPGNYGFCAACHVRDIAGALGIHKIATLQYARPEKHPGRSLQRLKHCTRRLPRSWRRML